MLTRRPRCVSLGQSRSHEVHPSDDSWRSGEGGLAEMDGVYCQSLSIRRGNPAR